MGKVLVVDDEDFIREMVKDILDMNGIESVLTEDGAQAIEQLKSDSEIKVAVVDYNLPDISGKELIEKIEKLRPDVSVFLVTGMGEEALNNFSSPVFKGTIAKPFNIDDFVEKIRRVMG